MLEITAKANAKATERTKTRWQRDPERMAQIATRNATKGSAALRGSHFDPSRLARHSEALTGRKMGGVCAATPDHIFARDYSLRAPDGTIYEGRNIYDFVREHATIFEPADVEWNGNRCRAAKSLNALRPTAASRKRQWKGWTWAMQQRTSA